MSNFEALIDSLLSLLKEEHDIIEKELNEYGEYSCNFGSSEYSATIKFNKEVSSYDDYDCIGLCFNRLCGKYENILFSHARISNGKENHYG